MSKPFNKLNFSLPFGMDTAVPVDYNSFFTSYSEASAAASTAVSAGSNESIYYIGQQLYVVDDAEKTVKTYLISHDRTLTDIGKVYSFTSGLSSEYLSSTDTWNIGIDTTNIVAPSSASEYLKFADAKRTYDALEEKLPKNLQTGTTSIVLPYDDDVKSYLEIKDSRHDAAIKIASEDDDDGNIIEIGTKSADEVYIPKKNLYIDGNITLEKALDDLNDEFSNYLHLSGGTLSGTLDTKGHVGIIANESQIVITPRNLELIDINGDFPTFENISIPFSSGTIALTSQYLSGYGITDAYTKSETMCVIDGNGRYPIKDITPVDGDYSLLPIESFATEIVSSNGDNITFVHKELNTFNQSSDYFPGILEWYHGGVYKCIRQHKGEWDENDFVRVMRDMWLSIDCTGIDTNINVTWPSNIDVFNSALSSDIAPVSGEYNVYHITEYANDHFAITRYGGGVSYEKIEELSLMAAKNTQNIAENTNLIIGNSNDITELKLKSDGFESASTAVEAMSSTWNKSVENSLMIAINAENMATTALQSITNYNLIMDLYEELHPTA